MARGALIYLLCAFGFFYRGLTAVVQTQRTVMAAVGGEALLSCQLIESKEVVQVTWQKSEGERNLASYTEEFGERVTRDFRHKVEFKDAGLQNSSIIIRKVTEQDEGCYHCLFNTYPDGALTGTTCIKLYELHGPVLHVAESNSTEETVVSCSATGRPAPTVTLRVLRHSVRLSNYKSDSVSNTNGTVTVTATGVLPRFHGSSTQVVCAVQVPSGPQIEVFMMMPEVNQTSADDFVEESESDHSGRNFSTLIIVLSLMAACGCVAAVVLFIRKCKCSLLSRTSEVFVMDIRSKDAYEAPTIMGEMQIRKRSPPESNRTSLNPEMSPSAARRLTFISVATE